MCHFQVKVVKKQIKYPHDFFCLIYHSEAENSKVLEEVEDTLGKIPVSLSDHMEGCLWTKDTYTELYMSEAWMAICLVYLLQQLVLS